MMDPPSPAAAETTEERHDVGMGMTELFEFLDRNGIGCQRCDHPAVYTVEESARLVPPLPGAKTKNLSLRDKPGRRHFLVCVPAERQVDLRTLSDAIGCGRLSFGSADRLMARLGVEPGSRYAAGGCIPAAVSILDGEADIAVVPVAGR